MPVSNASFLSFCFVALLGSDTLAKTTWVTNHENDSTVRYPVILLRGNLPLDRAELSVSVDDRNCPLVQKGKQFKSLVKLNKGENTIRLTTSESGPSQTLRINYTPQTNPYYVRMIWMTDDSGATQFATPTPDHDQDYAARLRTAATLMQTLTAERMHDIGLPRKTFRLERDAQGEVIVHTLRGTQSAEDYYAMPDQRWWRHTFRWLNDDHPDSFAKNIVLAAYTRKDPETGKMKAHTALGGGNLGLFGSASVFSWPRSLDEVIPTFQDDSRFDTRLVHNDSVGRNTIWGLASTTLGATLHEMGHTFGLPHCTDPIGMMTRGFDHFNRVFTLEAPASDRRPAPTSFSIDQEAYFAPISATYLKRTPWFQLDVPAETNERAPKVSFDAESGTLAIRSSSGVAWVGFWVDDRVHQFKEFADDEIQNEISFNKKQLESIMKGKPLKTVTVLSKNGKPARFAMP